MITITIRCDKCGKEAWSMPIDYTQSIYESISQLDGFEVRRERGLLSYVDNEYCEDCIQDMQKRRKADTEGKQIDALDWAMTQVQRTIDK